MIFQNSKYISEKVKSFLTSKTIQISLLLFFILFLTKTEAQVIFNDDFGQTTVRQTSPYMPAGSFVFGDPAGTILQRSIENNHYAVIDPTHIVDDFPASGYWFWSGPVPSGNTGGGFSSPSTNDHTTGDTNGAVMAVNVGTTSLSFYSRPASLEAGKCYSVTFWMYLVNANSEVVMDIRDGISHSVLKSQSFGWYGTTGVWKEFTLNFAIPSGCSSSNVEIELHNGFTGNSGIDYYIDDIELRGVL